MAELTITQKRQLEGALKDIDNACQKLVYVFGFKDGMEKVAPLQALAQELHTLNGEVDIRVTGKGRKPGGSEVAAPAIDDPRSPEEIAADEKELRDAADSAAKNLLNPPEAS